ncbi:cardiomyopathy-associated protein 5 [Denticeps clupeoides]|uniref:Cardiomyopathy-associated protein 5 n=1 Tax=Denticeps clupeoides TaxID=299321 RepID=A0AAY4BM45_9TELE|nr:cardiomyopathy-associated protein 5-like [Denticeps clupeoides]
MDEGAERAEAAAGGDSEAEELHSSLKEVMQDQSVKPKFQCLMVDPSFSMVTVQSEDSGIVWETASSRCSTPWASEASSTSESCSVEGSGAQGKIVIIMDEEKIVRRRKKTSGRSSRFKRSGSRSAAIGTERPMMAEVSVPNVRQENTDESAESKADKEQELFSLISEGYEILNVVVPSKLPTVDEEEAADLEENLSYLQDSPQIKSKCKEEVTPALEAFAGPVEVDMVIEDGEKVVDVSQTADSKPQTKEGTMDMDYFEKFTLVDDSAPGGEPAASEMPNKEEVEPDIEQLKPEEESKPAGSPPKSDSALVVVSDVEIASEHLDEVFYGNSQMEEEENENGAVMIAERSKSLKESGSVLFGSQESILTPVFLPTGPPKIIDPCLLDEPTAMSFLYSDLYEDALGDRRREEDCSDVESVVSEKSFKRQLSDDEEEGYLQKFILKDETPTVQPVEPESGAAEDNRLIWPQTKFELTGCLLRAQEEDAQKEEEVECTGNGCSHDTAPVQITQPEEPQEPIKEQKKELSTDEVKCCRTLIETKMQGTAGNRMQQENETKTEKRRQLTSDQLGSEGKAEVQDEMEKPCSIQEKDSTACNNSNECCSGIASIGKAEALATDIPATVLKTDDLIEAEIPAESLEDSKKIFEHQSDTATNVLDADFKHVIETENMQMKQKVIGIINDSEKNTDKSEPCENEIAQEPGKKGCEAKSSKMDSSGRISLENKWEVLGVEKVVGEAEVTRVETKEPEIAAIVNVDTKAEEAKEEIQEKVRDSPDKLIPESEVDKGSALQGKLESADEVGEFEFITQEDICNIALHETPETLHLKREDEKGEQAEIVIPEAHQPNEEMIVKGKLPGNVEFLKEPEEIRDALVHKTAMACSVEEQVQDDAPQQEPVMEVISKPSLNVHAEHDSKSTVNGLSIQKETMEKAAQDATETRHTQDKTVMADKEKAKEIEEQIPKDGNNTFIAGQEKKTELVQQDGKIFCDEQTKVMKPSSLKHMDAKEGRGCEEESQGTVSPLMSFSVQESLVSSAVDNLKDDRRFESQGAQNEALMQDITKTDLDVNVECIHDATVNGLFVQKEHIENVSQDVTAADVTQDKTDEERNEGEEILMELDKSPETAVTGQKNKNKLVQQEEPLDIEERPSSLEHLEAEEGKDEEQGIKEEEQEDHGLFPPLRSFSGQEDLSVLPEAYRDTGESAEDLDFEIVTKQDATDFPGLETVEVKDEEDQARDDISDDALEDSYEFIEAPGEDEVPGMDTFCLVCCCPILGEDKLFGEHRDHEVSTLDKAYDDIKNQLSDWISALQERSENIEDLVSELELGYNSVEEMCKTMEQEMEHQNEEMLKMVMDQYNEMSQSMEEEKKAKLEQLYDQIVSFQESIDAAKEVLEKSAKDIHEEDPLTFLSSSKDINQSLTTALETAKPLELGPRGLPVFDDYAKGSSTNGQKHRKGIPVPQKPHLQAQEPNSATSTSVTVYWTVNEGDIIDCFQVYCMEEPQGAISEEYRVTVKESYCTLEELEPDKCYKVWVMAVNYTGCSLPSERLSFRTAPSAATIQPESCSVLWDSATLRWSSELPGESFTLEYCRQYACEGEGLRSISGIRGHEQKVLLQPNENYLFYIKSVNSAGASEQSEAALISTRGTRFHFLKETASPALTLSEDESMVVYSVDTKEAASVLECPVILGEILAPKGYYYWETVVSDCQAYRIGVAYSSSTGNFPPGEDSTSWCLHCVPTSASCRFELLHDSVQTDVFVVDVPERIGTLLDFIHGKLVFFNAQNCHLLGSMHHRFTGACQAVFGLESPGSLKLQMLLEVPAFAKHY